MLQGTLRDIDIWWYWVNIGWYWLVFGGTGSVWGSTGWYLVILGQYNLVLFGIKWYWVNKGLLCLYILKKINGDVNRPTDQPTDRPTDQQGEYRAICLFRKLENRKKAEICNNYKWKYNLRAWPDVAEVDSGIWRFISSDWPPESRKAVVGYSYSWKITALWDSGGFWTTSFDHQQPTSIVII